MTKPIRFTKMHGAGNDYIYINTLLYNIDNPMALACVMSDRHKGVGSDGLVLIGASTVPEADYSMRIFNADGSEAMMCGNASRCVGKYLYEKGLTDKTAIRLQTLSGIKTLQLHIVNEIVESVTVDMGEPVFENDKQYLSDAGNLPRGCFVSMGNPHFVIFVDQNEDTMALAKEYGALTVTPLATTCTSGTDTKVYDGTPLTNGEITCTNLVSGDNASETNTDGLWNGRMCHSCSCSTSWQNRTFVHDHDGWRYIGDRMA